ncbi:MAG: hypothetical protein M0042_16185 [Nitrospiraceae bacterium]|nr:hypothetical protein [Nitrospiraceae bacterium]
MRILLIILLTLINAAFWTPVAFGADDRLQTDGKDRAHRRLTRERLFLERADDDLTRSLRYVQEMLRGIEKQVAAVESYESTRREQDLQSFLEWYQSYAAWLGARSEDIESALLQAYSSDEAGAVRQELWISLVNGYGTYGSQLDERLARLVILNDRTQQRMSDLRRILEYVTSVAFIEARGREKQQSEPGRDRRKDEMYERYKEITDAEIVLMQRELKSLDELQKHYAVLLETGRLERAWIDRKYGDVEVMGQLAAVIGRSAAAVEEVLNRVIRQYESDSMYFKRKIEDIARSRSRIVPSGSLASLDRTAELSDLYDRMNFRFEHHVTWLSEQIGAYRADLVEIRNNKY